MIHIAICDDEQYMADRIRDMAVAFFWEKKIEIAVSQFANGKELIQYKGEIHILFLDIQMEEPDGMETARKLRSENFKGFLIFITVLKEMVFQAFEVQAYDYLVKPVGERQFKRTMERLLLSMDSARKTSLLVQKGNESSVISFEDIIFCEVIDRKIYLHLKGAKILDYYDRIQRLEEKLDGRFYRCHRSYLINLGCLKGYKDGRAYMEDGSQIPVSRLRSREFSDVILDYMKNR